MENNNNVIALRGDEPFFFNGENTKYTVLDFWRFQFSNLPDMEGRVGEFIVAMALEKESSDNNNGWTLWDIDYRGKRIEVKTTSYYKPWRKDGEYSDVRVFGIQKSYPNSDGTSQSYSKDKENTKTRNNDIYVFVINVGKTKADSDPFNLDNWRFYIVSTSVINEKCRDNKTISLKKVQKISNCDEGFRFDQVKNNIDLLIDEMNNQFVPKG